MVKVTFSLDDATVAEIRRTAERLGTAQSQVVLPVSVIALLRRSSTHTRTATAGGAGILQVAS